MRTELRDTLGNWHPLGKWTALYPVVPAAVAVSLATAETSKTGTQMGG